MTEKVKLPKEVCDALDEAKKEILGISYYRIVRAVLAVNSKYKNIEYFNEQNADAIYLALTFGYEPELSAEEQIKNLYSKKYNNNFITATEANKFAIKEMLKILGIHYDWIEDAE